ncbi:MAG: glycoside hydrolase family 31 protein [Bacillota bacterium]
MKKNDAGFVVESSQDGYLHILFYGENIVRFAYSKDQTIPPSTVAVIGTPVNIGTSLDNNNNVIISEQLKIEIDRETLKVKISERDGNILSEDIQVLPEEIKVKKKKLWEKGIYGNGEKYSWINQIGSKTTNYNTDVLFHNPVHHPLLKEMHTAVPFYLGLAPGLAYGIYFDNSYRSEFDFGKTDPDTISFKAEDGNIDYYFIYGQTAEEVLKGYATLTGTHPLPRKNFLGYHQSRFSYENEKEIFAIADSLRNHEIPCDVLHLDIAYMDDYKVFTVDRKRFKNLKRLAKKLKKLGFSLVVNFNPGVKADIWFQVYSQGKTRKYFVTNPEGEIYEGAVWTSPAVFPDFLRSEVRRWWRNQHPEFLSGGIDGIWNDMNEPSDFSRASGTLPGDAVHLNDQGEKKTHAEIHNIYGLLQTQVSREAMERYKPQERAFVLTRAAFAGSQRYSALWTGDNASLWEHLEISIPMILNLGLSGIPFAGADVGGYRGDCSEELMVRWMQLGAFLPFFRNHSEIGTVRQEPWHYNPETLKLIRKYIKLRYRFITYFYDLFRENSLTGTPVVRPLFYHYQDDPATYNINDQFLLGENVMVCPVTRPAIDYRRVYLPAGLWYNYWSGEKLSGGRHIICEAPLETLPLFIKAGTVLPQDQEAQYIKTGRPLTVEDIGRGKITMHFYAGADGYYRLYYDDGISYDYLQGEYCEQEFFFTDDPVKPKVETSISNIKRYVPPEIEYKFHGVSGKKS